VIEEAPEDSIPSVGDRNDNTVANKAHEMKHRAGDETDSLH